MHNQHAGLSHVLADQYITQRRAQAAQAQLVRDAGPPRRRRRSWTIGGWWQLARRPGIAVAQPARRPERAIDQPSRS